MLPGRSGPETVEAKPPLRGVPWKPAPESMREGYAALPVRMPHGFDAKTETV